MKIIVRVAGGLVVGVSSDTEDIECAVLDEDNRAEESDLEELERMEALEKEYENARWFIW